MSRETIHQAQDIFDKHVRESVDELDGCLVDAEIAAGGPDEDKGVLLAYKQLVEIRRALNDLEAALLAD